MAPCPRQLNIRGFILANATIIRWRSSPWPSYTAPDDGAEASHGVAGEQAASHQDISDPNRPQDALNPHHFLSGYELNPDWIYSLAIAQ